MGFLITNIPSLQNTPKVIDLAENWKLCFDPDNLEIADYGKYAVKLHGYVNWKETVEVDGQKQTRDAHMPVEDNFEFDAEVYKSWVEWGGQEGIDFLTCLITNADDDEGPYILSGDPDAVDLLLPLFIPQVCGCGSPSDSLSAFGEVLKTFNHHPLKEAEPITVEKQYLDMLRLIVASADGLLQIEGKLEDAVLTSKGQLIALAIACWENDDDE